MIDKDFSSIHVPFEWEFQGHQDYDGYAWYRKPFGRLPVASNETMVLLLGKIDDTDQVFLNGKLIGETEEFNLADRQKNADYYRRKRVYEFPSSLLDETNLPSVHVHDSQGQGGI